MFLPVYFKVDSKFIGGLNAGDWGLPLGWGLFFAILCFGQIFTCHFHLSFPFPSFFRTTLLSPELEITLVFIGYMQTSPQYLTSLWSRSALVLNRALSHAHVTGSKLTTAARGHLYRHGPWLAGWSLRLGPGRVDFEMSMTTTYKVISRLWTTAIIFSDEN